MALVGKRGSISGGGRSKSTLDQVYDDIFAAQGKCYEKFLQNCLFMAEISAAWLPIIFAVNLGPVL
jgi:hypothetical protein